MLMQSLTGVFALSRTVLSGRVNLWQRQSEKWKLTGPRQSKGVMADGQLSAPHHVKFVIGSHRCEIRHPVGHPEKRGDAGNVPDIIIRKPMAVQFSEVFFIHGVTAFDTLRAKSNIAICRSVMSALR